MYIVRLKIFAKDSYGNLSLGEWSTILVSMDLFYFFMHK